MTASPVLVSPCVSLTEAERDIVRLLAAGNSTASTAAARGSAINTVRTQLNTLHRKLKIRHRGELVVWAMRHGFGGAE